MEEHPTLRNHKLKFAFFDDKGSIVLVKEVVLNAAELTEVDLEINNFVAVLPNYEDWAFIKILLDDKSRDFLINNFNLIQDSLCRLLIVRSLFESVRDGRLKSSDFVEFLRTSYLPTSLNNL